MLRWYLHKLRKISRVTGFQIPPNTIGKGLTIWHWGPVIINPAVRIGENCTLNPMVIIGHKVPGEPAPTIGNNVFISGGAKIIGDITIDDNVIIAPNAVVVKDVPSNVVVGGIPCMIIRDNR
jgi:serine O-acetyltransferase